MDNSNNKDVVSITGLLRVIYQSKKTLGAVIVLFLVLGMMIYVISPKEFSSQAVILPENNNSGIGLSGLASLAGINVGRLDDKSRYLNAAVYEPIIRSAPFLENILDSEYQFSTIGERITLREYLTDYSIPSISDRLTNLLSFSWLRSPSKSTSPANSVAISVDEESSAPVFSNTIMNVSSRKAVKDLRKRLYYSKDLQTGLITITLDLQDNEGAAQVLQKIIADLITITKRYQGQRDTLNIQQLDKQISEKKKEYEKALEANARFRDQNINLVRSVDQLTGQKLQNDIAFTFNIYNTLLQQREQIMIQSQNMQDPIAIIEPVQIAGAPSSPNPLIITVLSLFFGVVFGVVFVLAKNSLIEIIG
ncbi:MAG TPA: GNVR domain-containing protein [Cyclobacteriaceae bacterium]|nr:GNVR domain-containing protein [Cyclobacteriaceae bacterium]